MWIVTEHGYFSFVVDRKDPSQVWLRARVREDLERNFPGVTVIEKPGADYYFRAKISKTDLAARMTQMIMDNKITGHFKDVALSRSAPTKHGNRRSAYYGFWTALAALQPYAPYSKTPRPEPKPWTPPKPGRGRGQTGLPMFSGSGSTGGAYDWSSNPWSSDYIGRAQADPPMGGSEDIFADPIQDLLDTETEEEFEEVWSKMTDEEREAYLDEAEESQRRREEIGEELGAAVRADEDGWVQVSTDAYPAPRRPSRRERRRQPAGIPADAVEDQNRQAYLNKKAKGRKGRKNRHNQQGA